jgi:hypothetical protein
VVVNERILAVVVEIVIYPLNVMKEGEEEEEEGGCSRVRRVDVVLGLWP